MNLLSKLGPAILVVVLLLLIWQAGRAGFASLLTASAAKSYHLETAKKAAALDPNEANSFYVSGTILEASQVSDAIVEYQKAVANRPDDYALWLSLARARETNGETDAAI